MTTEAAGTRLMIVHLAERARPSWGRRLVVLGRTQPLGVLSFLVLLAYVLIAVFAPVIATDDPYANNAALTYKRPGEGGIMGTDNFGRDIFSRVVYGTRISMTVGFTTVFFAVVVAALVGGLSGYFGGKVDLITQRFVDAFQAFPALILAIIVVAVLSRSAVNVVVALILSSWPSSARVIRSQVLSLKETLFVEGARAVGASDVRIVLRHLFPNVLPILLVLASASVASVIIAEATLSFLGLGVPPPSPSWGSILTGAERYAQRAPWIGIFPGLAITIAVFAANFLGDTIRDLIDPRLRHSR
jgi:peptide/nickel transport system permease protein